MTRFLDWLANVNFARLNYILIPDTPEDLDRARASWAGRYIGRPVLWLYGALSREGRVVFVLAMFVIIGSLDVNQSSNHMLASLLAGALVASLAARRWFAMGDVSLDIEAPSRVTAGHEVQVRIKLTNRGPRTYGALQLERPFLSWDGSWMGPPLSMDGLPAHHAHTLQTRARFDARGRHYLDSFVVAEALPMRLALGPGRRSNGTPFLVVPRVAPVDHLRLSMIPRFQPGGVPLASKTGESSELYGLRPYRRGDRLRDLHARSWARTGKPVVREYQQEYFTRVGVFLDTDLSDTSERAFEAAISLAAGIVLHLSRGEALIDLLVTGDELHALTVGRSLGTFEQALDHLACAQPGPPFDRARTLGLLTPYLGRLSSVVLVVNHWDPPRQRLAQAMRTRGVAVKTVVIGDSPTAVGRDLSHVSIEQLEGDAGLSL